MRRPIAVLLVLCAAAAATLALGTALAARSTAAKAPLAGLDRTFRALQPAARCDAGAAAAARARRLRSAALKGAAEAPPKVVNRKKASMRRAIGLLRTARDLCAASPPPGGAPSPAPGAGGGAPPAPAPGTPPPAPGTQTISLSAAGGTTRFIPDQAVTAAAGPIRFQLANGSALTHSIGVRTIPGGVSRGLASDASAGNSTFVDIALEAGVFQIYCGFGDHADSGMVLPLTVTP